ncbi:alpha/beta hydrolase [Arthrobacter sp. Br18]|uniref:alpha/beta fold hydrolase n=1 Tax=Arthrobacter sp. Br18 TaxID=1312954 RepID=UPI00047D4B73|nr:alpha/beta hydrolase [Arthrobacter sp. Br18]
MSFETSHRVATPVLEVAFETAGPVNGSPVILLHGFPYDVRAFDDVAPILAARGHRVLAPYLRGFGATSFLDQARRSGQQAALAQDLLDFLDALGISSAVLAGYDWGGRAACIVAALFPERASGLVTAGGYNVQDISRAMEPMAPEVERSYWYQYYFSTERGRRGLEANRDALCELLWRTWSPSWLGAASSFPATAASLHNPDFVDVVIHSYRHRYGLAEDDPRYRDLEDRIAEQPEITVPTIVLESGDDGVGGPLSSTDRHHFSGGYELRHLPGVGHNVPQEAPDAFAQAVLDLLPPS